MASSVVTPEDVLETLMNDGTIDAIRLKIINQLKANEELRNNTITMVEQSKVLNTPGAEKQTKRELFDALRRELEMPVLEKASKAVWELIIDENDLGKEINETVERVFCRLSGIEHPPLPPQPSGGKLEKKEGKVNGNVDKINETGMSDSPPTRKRAFSEMNNGAEAVANGCTEHVSAESEDGAPSSSNARG